MSSITDGIRQNIHVEHKSNIPCIIAGDFNIDLTKWDKNRDTSDFLNSLLINNFMNDNFTNSHY